MNYYRASFETETTKKTNIDRRIKAVGVVDNVLKNEFYLPPAGFEYKTEIPRFESFISIAVWFFSGLFVLVIVVVFFLYKSPVRDDYEILELSKRLQTKQHIKRSQKKKNQIDRLITGAERAFSNADYIMPESKNAYSYYQQVLALQPDHAVAQDGLKNIENELFDLARFLYFGKQYKQSLNYLGQLEAINPNSMDEKSLRIRVESDWQEDTKITAWLADAEGYIKNNGVAEVSGNNAYEIYKKILVHQPGNEHALRGIDKINKSYLKKHISHVEFNNEGKEEIFIKKTPLFVPYVNKTNKKISVKQVSNKISQFIVAIQTGDKKSLSRMSRYVYGRERFVDDLFGQYKKINVEVYSFKIIAGENKAKVNVVLNDLVDINDRNVVPGGWSNFETTVEYNSKNKLKITW